MELSREFVKNLLASLRTMNLTIGAISFGLISNVMFVLFNTAAYQREELRNLLAIQDRLKSYSVGTLMKDLANRSQIFVGNYILTLSIDPAGKFLRNPLTKQITFPSIMHPMSFPYEPALPLAESNMSLWPYSTIGAIKTLREFKLLWDALASNRYILAINPRPLVCGLGTHAKLLVNADVISTTREAADFLLPTHSASMDFQGGQQGNPIVHLSLPLELNLFQPPFHGLPGASIESLTKVPNDENMLSNAKILVDLPAQILSIDILSVLLSKCKGIRTDLARASSFEHAFSNLSKLPNYYWALNLDDLEVRLKEKSESSKGQLEVFGVSIPNEMIVYVGFALLGILLLQFWSICRYLARNAAELDLDQASRWHLLLKGIGFSWIGRQAVWILRSVSAALSIAVVLRPHGYHWFFWWLVVFLSVLVVSVFSAVYVHRIYRKSESSNRSGDESVSNVEP
jgi:hypothetical protein